MIKIDVEQGTQEWLNLKAGVPSASNFDKIVKMNGERSKSAEKYMYQLAGERITGIRESGFQSDAMKKGVETEEEAVNAYEASRSVNTEIVGLCYKDEEKTILCSPDRLICDSKGLLEIKCPLITTQVGYLLNPESLKKAYFQQVQGQMFVTGYEYCDLMAYYPGLKAVIIRVESDPAFVAALSFELNLFGKELQIIVDKIK